MEMSSFREERFKPKYTMTREQNVFVVKRNIVDYIWKSARLEGINVTFPQTESIYNNAILNGLKLEDAVAINNLKRAWMFLLDNLDYPADYSFICKINQLVGDGYLIHEAGYIRKLPVSIGGTKWIPDIPEEDLVKSTIDKITKITSPTERAIELMLYIMRCQLFMNGNKRTSMFTANGIMVANGCGVITIPPDNLIEFSELLINFYETNNNSKISQFVYDNCIDGIPFKN